NLTRLIGPAAGGFLLLAVGAAGNFFVQSALYGVVVLTITAMRVPARSGDPAGAPTTMVSSMMDGFRYVRTNRVVFWLLALALVPMTFGLPYTSLLPIFAGDLYHIGPGGLGLLLSIAGLGSLVSNLVMASMRPYRRQGEIQIVALAAMGVA